jgi:arginine repressor
MQQILESFVFNDCLRVLSFGETLEDLLFEQRATQQMLVYALNQRGIEWSDNKVSRLVNNDIPDKLKAAEVRAIAEALNCNTVQLARLVQAFACHMLRKAGLF